MNLDFFHIMQAVVHYSLHFLAPGLIAFVFFKNQWKQAWLIMLATMLVDVDHLLATPMFDPGRCSIGYHPLHSYYAIAAYFVMLLFRKTRIIAIGLIFHMFTDWLDCQWSALNILFNPSRTFLNPFTVGRKDIEVVGLFIKKKVEICTMKQKIIKYRSDLFKQEVTLTVDESLNKLKGRVLAPKKLEAANKALKRLKICFAEIIVF